MVGIGIVGIGFMGMIHYLAALRGVGGRVVAVCSRDPRKLAGDWTSIQGNFGPRGGHVDLTGVGRHASLDDMLADPAVDLVDLCLPNDQHAEAAVRALEAGKHVLVEKPIALTVAEADAMVAAANANGRLLMVAHVLPFVPEFAFAAAAVRSGRYGALRAAHLTRVIARPDWSAVIGDAVRNGGPAIDLHVHDTHFVGLLCGRPRSVRSRGVVREGAVVHLATQYEFEDPNLTVTAVSGAISQRSRPFTHGFELFLDEATLTFATANRADGPQNSPLAVLRADGTVETPDVGPNDPVAAFVAELAAAVGAVGSGVVPPELSAGLARDALALCRSEVESVLSRGPVTLV